MCGVNEAMAAFKIVGAVASHREKKQAAANKAYADYKTQRHADAAYLNDLSKIETERGSQQSKILNFGSQYRKNTKNSINRKETNKSRKSTL